MTGLLAPLSRTTRGLHLAYQLLWVEDQLSRGYPLQRLCMRRVDAFTITSEILTESFLICCMHVPGSVQESSAYMLLWSTLPQTDVLSQQRNSMHLTEHCESHLRYNIWLSTCQFQAAGCTQYIEQCLDLVARRESTC